VYVFGGVCWVGMFFSYKTSPLNKRGHLIGRRLDLSMLQIPQERLNLFKAVKFAS